MLITPQTVLRINMKKPSQLKVPSKAKGYVKVSSKPVKPNPKKG